MKSFLVPGQGFRHKSSRLPLAKEFSPKINELQAITFDDGSAIAAQKILAPPKLQFLEKKIDPELFLKKNHQFFFRVKK